ncbi:hypothetical protein NL676_033258 [Syzygium grande]|nr:hypothetical protein NL676_033258 [Syzygium grande]
MYRFVLALGGATSVLERVPDATCDLLAVEGTGRAKQKKRTRGRDTEREHEGIRPLSGGSLVTARRSSSRRQRAMEAAASCDGPAARRGG